MRVAWRVREHAIVFPGREEKQQFLWSFLHQVAAGLPEAAVVTLPNEKCTDLRARIEGFPVRLHCEWNQFAVPQIEAKVSNPLGLLTLKFDPDVKQEMQAAPDPTWGDSGGQQRVFFGPSVFTVGDSAEQDARTLMRLPPELRWSVARAMISARIDHYQMRDDGIRVDFHDDLDQMPDAARCCAYLLSLVAWNAKVLAWFAGSLQPGATPGPATPPGATGALHLVQCRYCGAKSFLEHDARCRNCGAAFGT